MPVWYVLGSQSTYIGITLRPKYILYGRMHLQGRLRSRCETAVLGLGSLSVSASGFKTLLGLWVFECWLRSAWIS